MKLTKKTKLSKGFTLVELLVVIAIIAALAALATPAVLKQQKKAAATTATNNAKQIFLYLFEYDQEEGAYPTGTDTNVAFRLLFSSGYTSSEQIFNAKTKWSIKPDGDIGSGKVLEAKECGFKYVLAQSSGSPQNIPLLGAPFDVITANDTTFTRSQYGGRAVILFNDGSVRNEKIPGTADAASVPGNGNTTDVFAGVVGAAL